MGIKYIIKSNGLDGITDVIKHKFHSVYYKICDLDGKIVIKNTNISFDDVLVSANGMILFVEPQQPYTDTLTNYLINNAKNIYIISINKDYLDNLYDRSFTVNIGILDHPRTCNIIFKDDFKCTFFIVLYDDKCEMKISHIRSTFTNVYVYVYVYNIQDNFHIRKCIQWKVDGIIVDQDNINKFTNAITCLKHLLPKY